MAEYLTTANISVEADNEEEATGHVQAALNMLLNRHAGEYSLTTAEVFDCEELPE